MSRIKEFTYTRTATVNLGNYESTRVEVSQTVEVDARSDANTAWNDLVADVDATLAEKIDDIELGVKKANSRASRFGV